MMCFLDKEIYDVMENTSSVSKELVVNTMTKVMLNMIDEDRLQQLLDKNKFNKPGTEFEKELQKLYKKYGIKDGDKVESKAAK
jgi:LysM repeat protein